VKQAVTIREAGPGQAATLLALQREASVTGLAHIFPPERYPYPDEAVLRRWQTFEGRVLLAELASRPVGIAAVEGCWLSGLYVLPDHWGAGVAAVLHDRAVEKIAHAAHPEARLWVLVENRRARRFYERRGWVENGATRVVPYPPNPLDVGYSLALPPSVA